MAGKTIELMDLRQIIKLKHQGNSNRECADLLHLNRKTVDKYVQFIRTHELDYGELLSLSDKDLADLVPSRSELDSVRYQVLSDLFEDFSKELTQPGCTLHTLWSHYRKLYPDGYSYTQFTVHYRRWSKQTSSSMKLNHPAGQKLFVDYAGKKMSYIDRKTGEVIEAEVFVGMLPCSQYTFVEASKSQKREDFIDSMRRCLEYFGGAPQAIISDNLKAAVTKAHKYEPIVNKTFKDFALHYGCVIDPARPHHPKDKALVEGAVKLVYQRIFYKLSKQTFFSLSDLNKAIRQELEAYNNYLFSNKKGSRLSRFLDLEKQHLQLLPPDPYHMKTYKRAKVQKMGFIFIGEDKNYYSVPHRFIGRHVEVQYNSQQVEVYYNHQRLCIHQRSYKAGHYTANQQHLSSTHQKYSQWNPEYFAGKASKIGPHTRDYIDQLINQYPYPEVGYKQAMGICQLTRSYPKERLEAACQRALGASRYSYRTIENILKKNLDQLEMNFNTPSIPEHKNIRGAGYYN